MPANDSVTTETPAVPTVSPRFILVMASQLAAQAEGLLSDALTTLDLTDDPEGIDETIAQALTDLNAAVKQVRAFKQAQAAGVEFDRPAVFQIGGGMIRELADLFTLYGATTPEGFARRVAATSDFDLRVVGVEVAAVGEVGARPGSGSRSARRSPTWSSAAAGYPFLGASGPTRWPPPRPRPAGDRGRRQPAG